MALKSHGGKEIVFLGIFVCLQEAEVHLNSLKLIHFLQLRFEMFDKEKHSFILCATVSETMHLKFSFGESTKILPTQRSSVL